jgi:type IV secretion system protein VirB9
MDSNEELNCLRREPLEGIMKTPLLLLALALAAVAADKPPTPAVTVDAPRSVVVGERSVVTIYLSGLQDTMLVLPKQEKVRAVFAGDTDSWKIQTTKEPSRYVSLSLKVPGAKQTTLNLVSDHDKPYSFVLVESSVHCDSKVFIDPDSQLENDLEKAPAFLPASDVDRYKREAEQARSEVAAAVTKAKGDSERDIAVFRAGYPNKLRFDYRWDEKGADKFGVEQIFSDDKFTYIRAHPQETPALYEIKDGKPSLINFDFANGVYTAPKIVTQGYLAIGKQKMDFSRN